MDLHAYLARVGLPPAVADAGPSLETLTRLMEAQSQAIAFENIDVVLGKQISISAADIERQLVTGRRGGYCFQHNGLLRMALGALGFDVAPLLCKVRWNKAPDEHTTFTHVALAVTLPDGARYLADVGFAGTNSIAPLLLGSDEPQRLVDGVYRTTVRGDGFTVASSEVSGVWRDLYMFRDEPCPDIDLELANWWSCTHPTARFMTQFFASRAVGADRHHILDDSYLVRKADGSSETTQIESKAQLLELLETVFGLAPHETDGIDRYLPAQASI